MLSTVQLLKRLVDTVNWTSFTVLVYKR